MAAGHVESQTNFERDCPWKEQGNRRQQSNYASSSNQNDSEWLFVMQHMINSMSIDVSTLGENVRYVDSGASNHMTGHGEWFKEMQNLEWLVM